MIGITLPATATLGIMCGAGLMHAGEGYALSSLKLKKMRSVLACQVWHSMQDKNIKWKYQVHLK